MYRSYSAEQYKKHLGFNENYRVDGVLVYGTLYEEKALALLKKCLEELGLMAEPIALPNPFLRFAHEIRIGEQTIWFMIAYGGAWLSEYLHWACLFGSHKNILIGSCGGLKQGIIPGDYIVPSSSYGEESSAKIYTNTNVHKPNSDLARLLTNKLEGGSSKVWVGPTVTCQAMVGETLKNVEQWSRAGYYGVEMEASTVFAVSKHFGVPAAATVYVGDNLVEQHTNLSDEFAKQAELREQKKEQQMKAALALLLV